MPVRVIVVYGGPRCQLCVKVTSAWKWLHSVLFFVRVYLRGMSPFSCWDWVSLVFLVGKSQEMIALGIVSFCVQINTIESKRKSMSGTHWLVCSGVLCWGVFLVDCTGDSCSGLGDVIYLKKKHLH